MKVGDLVKCKDLWRPTGVMGSTLRSYKAFFEIGIIIGIQKSGMIKVLKSNNQIIIIKSSFLEVI
jgi:hypothetical protein